jgi:3-phosphoglycerate kinase
MTRVFIRADLNVPLEKGTLQDYRLQAILPTIDYVLKKQHKVILATHIGRPKAFDETLSTKILVPWFQSHNYKITHCTDLMKAIEKSHHNADEILLLENLRFFRGEQQTNHEFAQLLAQCADYYINDAFGLLHRADTSVTLLPELFDNNHKSFGLLFKKEIAQLTKLKENPQQPFITVLGGSKAETKIKVLEQFLVQPKNRRVTKILIGGALANTFLLAEGFTVGQSLVEPKLLPFVQRFLMQAEQQVEIILPIDVACVTTIGTPPTYNDISDIPHNAIIVDIGPKTINLFSQEIARAKTVFTNGTVGLYENPLYQTGTREVLTAIAHTPNSIVGGGDTVGAVYHYGLEQQITFLSTGGGATLSFLASTNPQKEFETLQAIPCTTLNDA